LLHLTSAEPADLVLRSLLRDHDPVDPQRATTLVKEYGSGLTMREVAARKGISCTTWR